MPVLVLAHRGRLFLFKVCMKPNVRNTKKKLGGRPSKFPLINRRQVRILCKDGKTDVEIAHYFGISVDTYIAWKKKNPKFSILTRDWKDKADAQVERSLYKRAVGYQYNETTYEKSKTGGLGIMLSDGDIEGIKHEDTSKTKIIVKEVAPDVQAQVFWLKNRQPKQWRDKVDVEHSGDLILNYGHRQ